MTHHHGKKAMETKTEWSTVNKNKGKKNNQETIPDMMEGKSNENEAVEVKIETIRALPLKHEKTVLTRINFTILPSKGITALSIPHSMNSISRSSKQQIQKPASLQSSAMELNNNLMEARNYQMTQKLPKNLQADTSMDSSSPRRIR
jgi:hypothetical protein